MHKTHHKRDNMAMIISNKSIVIIILRIKHRAGAKKEPRSRNGAIPYQWEYPTYLEIPSANIFTL